MFTCPNCEEALLRTRNELGNLWVCQKCSGRAVTFSVLRRAVDPFFLTEIWQAARSGGDRRRACPACGKLMSEITADTLGSSVPLDVCTRCQLVWFDQREFESAPPRPPPEPEEVDEKTLSPAARQALAIYQAAMMAEKARSEELGPSSSLDAVLGFFGLPIETEAPEVRRRPVLTWGLAAAILIVSLIAFADIDAAVDRFGFIPARPWRLFGLTWLSAFFLHAGILHLFVNLYFLLVFGDNVEDYLGRWRFALLALCANVVGLFAHTLADPRGNMPVIGASAGISGVLTFYTLSFPQARLHFLFRIGLLPIRWVQVPAWLFFAFWLVIQVWTAWIQAGGFGSVSAWAHLGGVFVGCLFRLNQSQR